MRVGRNEATVTKFTDAEGSFWRVVLPDGSRHVYRSKRAAIGAVRKWAKARVAGDEMMVTTILHEEREI